MVKIQPYAVERDLTRLCILGRTAGVSQFKVPFLGFAKTRETFGLAFEAEQIGKKYKGEKR